MSKTKSAHATKNKVVPSTLEATALSRLDFLDPRAVKEMKAFTYRNEPYGRCAQDSLECMPYHYANLALYYNITFIRYVNGIY